MLVRPSYLEKSYSPLRTPRTGRKTDCEPCNQDHQSGDGNQVHLRSDVDSEMWDETVAAAYSLNETETEGGEAAFDQLTPLNVASSLPPPLFVSTKCR